MNAMQLTICFLIYGIMNGKGSHGTGLDWRSLGVDIPLTLIIIRNKANVVLNHQLTLLHVLQISNDVKRYTNIKMFNLIFDLVSHYYYRILSLLTLFMPVVTNKTINTDDHPFSAYIQV